MCGITGIIDLNEQLDNNFRKETVAKMNAAILHRGPDGAGFFNDKKTSLAMRRLSIIDLHSGDQPLWNEDKSVLVFMNGEIYNYLDLKKDLQAKGHQFYSNSDTETLVHLYEEYGVGFSSHLKGMFAFCLYDLSKNQLLISRDRFGEKPLYYHWKDQVLSFSSEMASLLENKKIPRVLNTKVLDYYLGAAYVPEPLTLLKEVQTLEPGHHMIITKDKISIEAYFSIDYSQKGHRISDPNEAVEFIEPFLKQAVSRQSISDVPLGAFLSGGIDSSTICALLQEQSSRPIDTFTVKFEEASYDESHIAREVAQRIGSNHHEITIPNQEFTEEIFWEIIDHVGLPFPDSSAIPVFLITKEIRKHVKVALSGDGGDEIFAGYPVFGWWKKIAKIEKFPRWTRKAVLSLTNSGMLPLNANRLRQINRGVKASMKGEEGISLEIHRMFMDEEMQKILSEKQDFAFDQFLKTPPTFKNWSSLRKSMYHRIKHNLVTDMLIKVDRMSMANSLEVRAPFLDPDLFKASLRLSDELLYDGKTGKKIIREIMKSKIPDSVFNHPKSGFSIPLHKYQNETYRKLSEELLDKSNPLFNVLDFEQVQKLNQSIFSSQKNTTTTTVYRSSHQHWTLMMLAGWIKRFNINAE